ncbi:hypothetical protein GALMADRAFT_236121 [Galerina marginata CBS 339.88]|uniref:AMP-dependent synthetase/ligase domain-containing protein n=1 Tax=Galerina marginata (strain CBS 339.88) TaxID=685588 RepID=A0A067TN52_GALM3|nr:hypothetical protein GALMADRAFT_236121 [Galerina marginata CBS 339.88]
MSQPWSPKRTLTEVNEILMAPGQMHQVETRVVDGQLQRVYKNLWPSLRVFWLWAAQENKDVVYAVFENRRYTFAQVFERSLKAASIFYDVYGIRKGDRVAICARNFPEVLVAFWACHLLGAVSALLNAWSPLDTLRYCLARTECKLIIVDPERADKLEPFANELIVEAGSNGILVLESGEGRIKWNGMKTWDDAFHNYEGDPRKILRLDPKMTPEDNATILFTSGTTGMPKGVLSTQRQFLTNLFNVTVGGRRAALRRGEDIPAPPVGPQKGILLSVPLFHVTGLTSLVMLATMAGLKIVMMRKWDPEEGARLIKNENIAIAGGVPSMVSDLADSSGAGQPLEGLMFGGAPAPDSLTTRAKLAFPTASLSQGYGLTETSSVAVGFAGEDYMARPASCGLPTPINDLAIMNGDVKAPPGTVGEVWIRGPNVMKGYWRDQEATDKVLTKDAWFKTGDLGFVDQEGFLYIRDRIKDIIIRGGENIDSVSVENAIYADDRVLEVAAVGVPDKRLGELVAAVVSVKPAFHGKVTEAALVTLAQKSLPKFAVPVMILIQNEPFERTPSGKILKADLRKLAAIVWLAKAVQTSKTAKL